MENAEKFHSPRWPPNDIPTLNLYGSSRAVLSGSLRNSYGRSALSGPAVRAPTFRVGSEVRGYCRILPGGRAVGSWFVAVIDEMRM